MTPTLIALLALLGHWGEVGHRLIGSAAAAALPADMPAFFREARVINDAGILGHYVADGSNPHHTTIHFDGWVGDNPKGYTAAKGFHARFESIFVQTHFVAGDLHVDEAPRVFPSLRDAILAYLHESNTLVPRLYDLDKHAPFDSTTTDADDKKFAAERLNAGARMLRDVWWTAWITSGQTVETVESVIQHDIVARGGADKIHALRTVRQTGLLINGKDSSRLVIESRLPDAMRMEITSGGKTLVRAYDGRTGWQKVPGQNTTNLMTPAEQRNISHEADLLSGLVDYTAKGNKVALAGTELVEGRDAYKVQVTLRDSTTFTYFIDRQTWLPVKWQGGPWETMYRSFIDVGGVKIPSRFETTQRGSTIAPPTVLVITSATANPNLPDSRFAPPPDAK